MSIPSADAINSIEAEMADWLHSVIDIPGPPSDTMPYEEQKLTYISPKLLENTSEENYVKYYKPQMVSIGPINQDGGPHDKPMKDFKRKAVQELAEIVKDEVSIEQVYTSVEPHLLRARNRYSGSFMKVFEDDREWCKMMFLDSCFVVAFICSRLKMRKDYRDLVRCDLLLYENQLPFEVLHALADAFTCEEAFNDGLKRVLIRMPFVVTTFSVPAPTFLAYIESCLCIKFRRGRWLSREVKKIDQFVHRQSQSDEARAHAHLLQYYLDPLIRFFKKTYDDNDDERFRDTTGIDDDDDDDDDERFRAMTGILSRTEGAPNPPSTVTELKKKGIKCSGTSKSNISLYSYMCSGKLVLPQLTFDRRGKTLFLNLAAYEFSSSPKYRSSGIASYLSFMGTFIHGEKDVKELRAREILQVNEDGDDHAVLDFFRYITSHHEPNTKVIKRVKRQISTYCKSKMLRPRVACAEIQHRYFSGPWNFLVFLAIFFTASMTIIQTVFTGIQTFKKD